MVFPMRMPRAGDEDSPVHEEVLGYGLRVDI
jgi:hypothetical protein